VVLEDEVIVTDGAKPLVEITVGTTATPSFTQTALYSTVLPSVNPVNKSLSQSVPSHVFHAFSCVTVMPCCSAILAHVWSASLSTG
jgi:hypothetical protein